MFDLQNKIALVTGASGGIGAQIATALHAQGATVVLHGTRVSKLEALKKSLESAQSQLRPILLTAMLLLALLTLQARLQVDRLIFWLIMQA